MRFGISTLFVCWLIVLLIELASLYSLLHKVHDAEEFYFHLALIAVTLVVGATGLIISAIKTYRSGGPGRI